MTMGAAAFDIQLYSAEGDTESPDAPREITVPADSGASVVDVSPLGSHLHPVQPRYAPVPSFAPAFSLAFWAAVTTLHLHDVSTETAARAALLAARAQALGVTEPSISLTDDDGVRLTWFKDEYTMHADATPAGVRWYFRKAESDACPRQGASDCDDLPDNAWRQLAAAESRRG